MLSFFFRNLDAKNSFFAKRARTAMIAIVIASGYLVLTIKGYSVDLSKKNKKKRLILANLSGWVVCRITRVDQGGDECKAGRNSMLKGKRSSHAGLSCFLSDKSECFSRQGDFVFVFSCFCDTYLLFDKTDTADN